MNQRSEPAPAEEGKETIKLTEAHAVQGPLPDKLPDLRARRFSPEVEADAESAWAAFVRTPHHTDDAYGKWTFLEGYYQGAKAVFLAERAKEEKP